MKLTIASGGNRTQHFFYRVLNRVDYLSAHEIVIPPFQQTTAGDDLTQTEIDAVTLQLRQAGFVPLAEVVAGQLCPGTYVFS